jgi:hypothetical protein
MKYMVDPDLAIKSIPPVIFENGEKELPNRP